MKKLEKLVIEILKKHPGGEEFFTQLDESLRNDYEIMENFINLIPEGNLVVSGKFGIVFCNVYNQIKRKKKEILLMNGGLRGGAEVEDISYLNLAGKNFIFVDDSFYSGKTRNKINKELKKNGAKIIQTFVIYDGSKNKDSNVTSLYRYHKE